MKYSKSAVAGLILLFLHPTYSHAVCVTPIPIPSKAAPSQWNDLLTAKAQSTLNPIISEVQDIDTTGVGDLNLDFYALTFDPDGKSAEEWLSDFRIHIDQYIYGGTTYSLKPFDSSNEELWNSKTPTGAVLVFNLANLLGSPIRVERGAVVLSCIDSTSFIFSTISIHGLIEPGDHPVSGNRGFGFVKNIDGSITFFTKATDRLKGSNASFAVIGSKTIFERGAEVWNGLLDNLIVGKKQNNPRNRVSFRRTVPYPLVPFISLPWSTTYNCTQLVQGTGRWVGLRSNLACDSLLSFNQLTAMGQGEGIRKGDRLLF